MMPRFADASQSVSSPAFLVLVRRSPALILSPTALRHMKRNMRCFFLEMDPWSKSCVKPLHVTTWRKPKRLVRSRDHTQASAPPKEPTVPVAAPPFYWIGGTDEGAAPGVRLHPKRRG